LPEVQLMAGAGVRSGTVSNFNATTLQDSYSQSIRLDDTYGDKKHLRSKPNLLSNVSSSICFAPIAEGASREKEKMLRITSINSLLSSEPRGSVI